MINEQKQRDTEKQIKIEAENCFSNYRKTVDYNELIAPIIYNFISYSERTAYLYYDTRKKLYKIDICGHIKDINYMPFKAGINFDTVWTDKSYENCKKLFKEIAINIILENKVFKLNELCKSIQDKNKRNILQRELWTLPELHN